jgi:hypothetical protein
VPYILADEKLEPAANLLFKTLVDKTPYKIGRLSLYEGPADKYKLTLVSKAFGSVSADEALNTISKAIGKELSELGDVEVITSDYKGYKPIPPKN